MKIVEWLRRIFRWRRRERTVTIRNRNAARSLPQQTPFGSHGSPRDPARRCECGGRLIETVLTTGGAGCDPELWEEYPLAVDGWRCRRCGAIGGPRFLDDAEMIALSEGGVAHAKAGRLDEAEIAFRRMSNSWTMWAPGHFNLALIYGDRLAIEEVGANRPHVVARILNTMETHLRDALRGTGVPVDRVAAELVRVLLHRGAEGAAADVVEEVLARDDLEGEQRTTLEGLRGYVRTRGDLYEQGLAQLERYLPVFGAREQPLDPWARGKLSDAVATLQRFARLNPDEARAPWLAGLAYRRLGDGERAVCELARAFALEPREPDVGREYTLALLEVGRFAEAVDVARSTCDARPDDAELVANLAVVLLLAAKLDDADAAVRRAARLGPSDRITERIAFLIDDVRTGKRPQPKRLAELSGR